MKREDRAPEVDMLFAALKRSGTTKAKAVAALRDALRLVGRDGLNGEGSEVRELYGTLSLRFVLENEHFQFEKEGGVSAAGELGASLGGLSASTVNRWRREGKLVGYWDRKAKRFLYPNYQVQSGKVLEGVAECCACFREYGKGYDAKVLATRLLSPLTASSGADERAIDHLRSGAPEKAVELLKASFERR